MTGAALLLPPQPLADGASAAGGAYRQPRARGRSMAFFSRRQTYAPSWMTTAMGILLTVPSVPQVRPGAGAGRQSVMVVNCSIMAVADVLGAHVGGAAGVLEGLLEGVDAVVGVGGELVGGLAEAVLVLGDEGLRCASSVASAEKGVRSMTPSARLSVEALDGQDAVHAVHAEEGGLIAHGVGLGEDDGGGLVVDGQEHDGRRRRS